MSELGKKFMVAALGKDGAGALRKAAQREPQLDRVLIPRAIVSWLTFTTNHEYEGSVPGFDNSYVQFQKSSDGFSGSISLNEGVYDFEKASVYHLAASIAMALGVDTGPLDVSVRDVVLAKLGKSIDTLTKAQVLMQELKTKKLVSKKKDEEVNKVELPGSTHKPAAQQGPQGPIAPQKQPAMGQATQGAAPKTKLPRPPRQPGLPVGKSESQQPCEACGGHQFENNKFKGCICFRDLSKSIKTTAYGDGYVLDFEPGIDAEAVRALMKTFRSRNG